MPGPEGTLEQLADYLINGFWLDDPKKTGGGALPHHFDHTNITYTLNLGGTATQVQAQTNLIVAALTLWSDVCGLTFTQVSSGGNLFFTNIETDGQAVTSPIFEATP